MLAIETGWPPPELLVTVSMHSGMRSRPTSAMSALERRDVHVALERMPQSAAAGLRG